MEERERGEGGVTTGKPSCTLTEEEEDEEEDEDEEEEDEEVMAEDEKVCGN